MFTNKTSPWITQSPKSRNPLFIALTTIMALTFFQCKKEDKMKIITVPVDNISCVISNTDSTIIAELNNQFAHTFSGTEPNDADPSLDNLIDYLGDATFVGLGEATHGTHDFFEMKDKIFRNLVEKKDFKAIVFELPWGKALNINNYVLKGHGLPNQLLKKSEYWIYSTREVEALTKWMQVNNEGKVEEDKIHFVGCDPQGGDFKVEKDIVNALLQKVQPDSLDYVNKLYKYLPTNTYTYSDSSSSRKRLNALATKKVYDFFIQNRQSFISKSSELEYEIALMATHVIQHREIIYRTNQYGIFRDSLMAYYTEWWQRILPGNAKVALWGHNYHISNIAGSTGRFLFENHSTGYKSVGFSFEKGSLNAFLASSTQAPISSVQKHQINKDICNTTNHVLSKVNTDMFYMIFEEMDDDTKQYFNTRHRFFQCGAGFSSKYIPNYIRSTSLSSNFDVLIHFDKASASELIN